MEERTLDAAAVLQGLSQSPMTPEEAEDALDSIPLTQLSKVTAGRPQGLYQAPMTPEYAEDALDSIPLTQLSKVTAGRKRGRPTGSKNKAKTPKSQEDTTGQKHSTIATKTSSSSTTKIGPTREAQAESYAWSSSEEKLLLELRS